MKFIILIILMLLISPAQSEHPVCDGIERWATKMAFVHLKNAGFTNNDKMSFSETQTKRLASQKIGDDLYRQIHHIVFTELSGETIEVITRNDSSNVECSMSPVDVYVIKKHLGG